jgi:hypothetical protein
MLQMLFSAFNKENLKVQVDQMINQKQLIRSQELVNAGQYPRRLIR